MLSDLIRRFDDAADSALDPLRKSPVADRVFYTASALGDYGLIWIVFALLRALRGGRTNEKAALRGVAATGVESFLVNVLLKSIFGRGRPVREIDHPLPIRQPLTSSFPSGHATAAFCGALLLSEDDLLAPVYFGAALIIATSRCYVRIHHASDVFAGALVGLGLGKLGKTLVPLKKRHR